MCITIILIFFFWSVHAAQHFTNSLSKDSASGLKSAAVGVPFRQLWPCKGLSCSPCPLVGCGRSGASGHSSACSGTAAAQPRSRGSSSWAQSPLPGIFPAFPPLDEPPPHPSPPEASVQRRLCRRGIWCQSLTLFLPLCTGEKKDIGDLRLVDVLWTAKRYIWIFMSWEIAEANT